MGLAVFSPSVGFRFVETRIRLRSSFKQPRMLVKRQSLSSQELKRTSPMLYSSCVPKASKHGTASAHSRMASRDGEMSTVYKTNVFSFKN
ncbi:hypothetical protein R1flu_014055 [Riccia fluitans]|uniref:Uncharacterized protein n=1 Tax=Riccia fluitans TaxID=41844 RepID=A0ABD1YG45_9MARC